MPLTQSSSNYAAFIESYLDADLRFAARHLAVLHDVPAHRWASVPALRQVFETAAVVKRSEELRVMSTESKDACVQDACSELGLPFETVKSRLYRAWCSGH